MYICYIDESGDSATINNPTDLIQPMLAVVLDKNKVFKTLKKIAISLQS